MSQVTGLTIRTQEHHTLASDTWHMAGARITAAALALWAWRRGNDKWRFLTMRNLLQGRRYAFLSQTLFSPEHLGDTLGRA